MGDYFKKFIIYTKANPMIFGLSTVAVVGVIVGGILIYQYTAEPKPQPATEDQVKQEEAVTPEAATTTPEAKAPTTPTTIKKPSTTPAPVDATAAYVKALKDYAKYRIQFTGCVPTPSIISAVNKTAFMFDNRNKTAITVKIDGASHNIGALSYKIVTVSNSNLPHTAKIDCVKGGVAAYSVATIKLLQ